MGRIIDLYCRLLKCTIAFCLAVMVVLVFGNVVLRYAFNSGITVSEELSRWLMVWLTFLGAIVALRERRISASTPWCARCRQPASASASS